MSRIRWGFIWYRKTVRISCPSIISRIRWGFIWNLKTARISRYWKVYHEQDQVRIHLKSENCQNFSLLEGLLWAGSGEDSFEIWKLPEVLATGTLWWAGSGEDSFEIGKLSEFLALRGGTAIMSRIRWGFIWNLKTVSISCSKQVEHQWWTGSGEDSFEIRKLPEFLAPRGGT